MKASKVIYNGVDRIKVDFQYDAKHVAKLKSIHDACWSHSLKSWHIPYSKEAFEQLKVIFPKIEYLRLKKVENKESLSVTSESKNKPAPKETNRNKNVFIHLFSRSIVVKLPKNDSDVRFMLSFRFSRWDKKKFCWVIPNFSENLNLLKDYFKERIAQIVVEEQINIDANNSEFRTIEKDVLLLIKTRSGRLKLYFGMNRILIKLIKSMPNYSWNKQNKYWSTSFSEKYLEEIRSVASSENLRVIYEEEEADLTKKSKRSSVDIKNYRQCPAEYILKIQELRYSEQTLKVYRPLFEEFINYFNAIKMPCSTHKCNLKI